MYIHITEVTATTFGLLGFASFDINIYMKLIYYKFYFINNINTTLTVSGMLRDL